MKLYLVRHGEAEPKVIHPERPLTTTGRREVERAAQTAAERITDLDVIWHSTKTRAQETAEILSARLHPRDGLIEREGLAPNDAVGPVAVEIASGDADVLIVSHIPFLHKLADRLLEGSEETQPVHLDTAGFACLEADDALNWFLAWTFAPGEPA